MSCIKLEKGLSDDQKVDVIVNVESSKIDTSPKDGEVGITISCNVNNCKKIIYEFGLYFGHMSDVFEKLYRAYYKSLNVLKDNELHSISFPLISSEVSGYGLKNPALESTEVCLEVYDSFVRKNEDYEIDVLLCVNTDSEFNEAKKRFDFREYIENNKDIKRIELTNELIDIIDYNDIIAVTISDGGAMGEPNCFYVVDKEYNIYHTNFCYDTIDYNKLQNKFTILKEFDCFFEGVRKLEKKWAWFNMGFGNYLMVRSSLEKIVKKFIDENLGVKYEYGELYQKWFFILKYINDIDYK